MATRLSRFMAGKDAGKHLAIDISAGEYGGHLAAREPRALLSDGGEGRRARAFGAIMRALEDDRDRLSDLVVAHFDDPVDVPPQQLERHRLRRAARHAVGELRG